MRETLRKFVSDTDREIEKVVVIERESKRESGLRREELRIEKVSSPWVANVSGCSKRTRKAKKRN